MKRRVLRLMKWTGFLGLVLGLLILASDAWVRYRYASFRHQSLDQTGNFEVALVLGTGRNLGNGRINLYYQYRLEAAEALYKSGKVKYLLLSGDNGSIYYNEPMTMKRDLVARGIPAERIYLDYAGFRTLDSVVRCRAVFGQQRFLIVSQGFHTARAVHIARHLGMDAESFDAQPVAMSPRMWLREKLARFKMTLDLLWGTQPKFLGPPVRIGQ
jgi:SanA protein